MFAARFLLPTSGTTTNAVVAHRSKLFSRRYALRCSQVVPAQSPSDITTAHVAPERAMAIAVVDGTTPTCIQPSVKDLCISAAEPSTDTPEAVASAPAPVGGVAAPNSVAPVTADTPDVVKPAPPSKVKKRGRKRENSVPGTPQRKRASRKMSSIEESGAGAAAVGTEVENCG